MVYGGHIYIILPNDICLTTKIFLKNTNNLCNFRHIKEKVYKNGRKVTKFWTNEKTQIREYAKKSIK